MTFLRRNADPIIASQPPGLMIQTAGLFVQDTEWQRHAPQGHKPLLRQVFLATQRNYAIWESYHCAVGQE